MILLKQTQRFNHHTIFSSCASCSLWFFLFAIIMTLVSCASLKSLIHNKPNAVFEQPVYDFGFAGPKQKIIHTFSFSNNGSLPLLVDDVSADCGCTAALVPEPEISPGKIGEIRAECETMRYEGKQEKHITLRTNDPEAPEVVLTLKGTIKRDVAVVPQGISFGEVKKGEPATKRFRILQLSNEKLVLNKVEADDRYYSVKTNWFEEENSRGCEIEITLKPDVPVGTINDVITLHTNVRRKPRIDVMVWANIKE